MEKANSQSELIAALASVQARCNEAARRAERNPVDVRLIAVSKTHPAEAITPLLEAGHRAFGENRVQEAQGKWPDLKRQWPDVELHLIGQLQSNKAQAAVELFDVIHALDRPSLAQALARAMDATGRTSQLFVQVNVGDEPQKGGCPLPDLPGFLREVRGLNLPVCGLMAIPPAHVDPAPYFALLAKLAARHGLPRLSMGMTSDFELAIQLGATDVRVGTALFGARG